MGFVPAGAHRNRSFRQEMVILSRDITPVMRDVLFDPQTSGGLLIGCAEQHAIELEKQLHDVGVSAAAIIGSTTTANKGCITIV